MPQRVTRRRFVEFAARIGGVALLTACGGAQSAGAPTTSVVNATNAPSPATSAASSPRAAPAAAPSPTGAPAITTSPQSAGPVQLKIGGWYDKGTQQSVQKQLDLFHQKFPNVTVSIVQIDFDPAKNAVLMASGAAPDVFWVNNDQTAPWAARHALRALDDYIKRDNVNLDDLFEIGRVLYSYAGHTYGLTEYLGPLMVMYNPKLFEAAGVTPPPSDYKDPSWTLDALVEKAKALTKVPSSGPAEQYGLFVATDIYRWAPIMWDFGGDFTDNPETPTKITFDSAGTRQAAQWVADLMLKHKVMATVLESQSIPFAPQFETGRLAMLIEGPWEWPLFMDPNVRSKVPWEVAAMPRGPAGAFTRLAGNAYGMSSQTKSPDMAWELLKFNTIGEGQAVNWTAQLAKGIPALKSMAEDARFGTWFSAPSKKAVTDLPLYSRIFPIHPNWAVVASKVNPEFDQVWIGKRSVDAAVPSAQQKMAQAFAQANQ